MDERTRKKEVMKDIIHKLHQGLTVQDAKTRFEKEVGNVTSTEVAEIEQSLINEGLAPEEIKRFCNVHALLFESTLQQALAKETSASHPVYLFKLENREVEKLLKALTETAERDAADFSAQKKEVAEILQRLKGVEQHYERKEQVLFPYLERGGFTGPSKVMWGKDNEIRTLFDTTAAALEKAASGAELPAAIKPLVEEVNGMIFKEENILFPTSLEKLSAPDWVEILKDSDEVGYVFIQKPAETDILIKHLEEALSEEATFSDNEVVFPTGALNLPELMFMLNTLPLDITFVDKEDRVRYFSKGRDRIFTRTKAAIGRKVQNCHPPQSLDIVESILKSFRDRTKDSYEFWIQMKGRFTHIRFFAVRDREGNYLGSLEVTQDVTDIKKLEGQKRLIEAEVAR